MKKPKTPQDVLRNGIEYLDALGWHRGSFQKEDEYGHRSDGPVCALGAVYLGAVNGTNTNFDLAYDKIYGTNDRGGDQSLENLVATAEDALTQSIPADHRSLGVASFNDSVAKQKRQIVALFNRAIKLLDNRDAAKSS